MNASDQLNSFESELRDNVADALSFDDHTRQSIRRETTFFADGLGIDSVDVLEVLSMLSREYDVEVPEKKREVVFEHFGALADFVSSQYRAESA